MGSVGEKSARPGHKGILCNIQGHELYLVVPVHPQHKGMQTEIGMHRQGSQQKWLKMRQMGTFFFWSSLPRRRQEKHKMFF